MHIQKSNILSHKISILLWEGEGILVIVWRFVRVHLLGFKL
jgi:hypothetical protein